jgi:hypothetical protein
VTDVDAAKNETEQTATLSIQTDNVDNENLTVDVSGVPQTAELRVSSALRFGLLRVGSSAERTLILRNDISATASINLTDISVIGRDAGAFEATDPTVPGTDRSKNELAPGEAASITVTLTPAEPGQQVATLFVVTDDPRQPGRAVFLSNTQTIGRVIFGSVTYSYTNIQSGTPLELFELTGEIGSENTGRITQVQPTVDSTDSFNLTFEGNETIPFNGEDESLKGVDNIRYIDINASSNLTTQKFSNNTIEFSVAKTTFDDRPNANPVDVELYQFNGTAYESVNTTAPVDEGQDFRYEATYTQLDSDLLVAVNVPELVLIEPSEAAINEGETVQVNSTVLNSGNSADTVAVELVREQDNQQFDNSSITIDAETNETVSLVTTPLDETTTLSVQGLAPTRNVTIDVGELDLVNAEIATETPVITGETVTVNVTVDNPGTAEVTGFLNLRRNGTIVNDTQVAIPPKPSGDQKFVQLTASLPQGTESTTQVLNVTNSLNNQSVNAGTITVESPADTGPGDGGGGGGGGGNNTSTPTSTVTTTTTTTTTAPGPDPAPTVTTTPITTTETETGTENDGFGPLPAIISIICLTILIGLRTRRRE